MKKEHLNKRILLALLFLSALAAAIFLIFRGQEIFEFLEKTTILIFEGNIEGLKTYLMGFGNWTPLLLVALIIFQSIVAPIPEIPLSMASGLLYGNFRGFLLAWVGVILGAWANFIIARVVGRPFIERFFKGKQLRRFDQLVEEYGELAILIGRLLPFIPFDFLSYAAGITIIRWWRFLFYTALGALPSTLAFVLLGKQLVDFNLFYLLFSIGILVLTFGFGWWYLQHRKKRKI